MRKVKTLLTTAASFITAAILLFALAVLPQRLAFKGGNSYRFFVGDTSKNCKEVTCTTQNAALYRLTLSEVCGESATYSSLDLDEYLNGVNGEVIFKEELEDSVNYYCKADLPYSVMLYGQEINLHVCVKDGEVILGTPIIFGGY